MFFSGRTGSDAAMFRQKLMLSSMGTFCIITLDAGALGTYENNIARITQEVESSPLPMTPPPTCLLFQVPNCLLFPGRCQVQEEEEDAQEEEPGAPWYHSMLTPTGN